MTTPTNYKLVTPGAQVLVKPHSVVALAAAVRIVCTAKVVQMTDAQERAFLATHS